MLYYTQKERPNCKFPNPEKPQTRKSRSVTNILFIASGGALGAVLRYEMSMGIHNLFGRGFPYGTLGVNIIGSILMGLLYIVLSEHMNGEAWRAGAMIGLLGAFTTFSTFSLETLNLLESGDHVLAAVNVILSVTLCIAGCWIGIVLGRMI